MMRRSQTRRGSTNTELAALLHRHTQVADAQQHLRATIRDLLTEAIEAGDVRDDVTPDELASYGTDGGVGADIIAAPRVCPSWLQTMNPVVRTLVVGASVRSSARR